MVDAWLNYLWTPPEKKNNNMLALAMLDYGRAASKGWKPLK